MEEITVNGIVLQRRDSGECDRSLSLLTRELGRIDAIAKGSRKSGSRLAASTEPLSLGQFHLAHGRHRFFVKQTQPQSAFSGLRKDFERLSCALALGELFAAFNPDGQIAEFAFDLLYAELSHLEFHSRPLVAMLWAELKLLELEGLMPDWTSCVATGERLSETPAFVSPTAGGYLKPSAAIEYGDRFQVQAEVLVALAKTADRDDPPENVRLAHEAMRTLLPFWRHHAHKRLPANEALIEFYGVHFSQ